MLNRSGFSILVGVVIAAFLVFVSVMGVYVLRMGPNVESPKLYAKEIQRDTPIVLTGDERMEIVDTRFTQKNDITLSGNATLVIQDSYFEHLQEYSSQFTLWARENARVVVKDSEVRVSPWLNWNFTDSASLALENVESIDSNVWHSFQSNARAVVRSSAFHGTIADNVSLAVSDSPSTFIEMVYPIGATVDEELPKRITNFTFPNSGENNVSFRLSIQNSQALAWGITTGPGNKITIRNAKPLVVTYAIKYPWRDVTAEFLDLGDKHYDDQTWIVEDSWLRLVNVQTWPWSPIVGDGNTLIVKNSTLADNQFSWGNSKIIIEESTTSLIRAKDSVDITLRNSTVKGDLVAQDSGRITLVNTRVTGKKIIEDNGEIIVQ